MTLSLEKRVKQLKTKLPC